MRERERYLHAVWTSACRVCSSAEGAGGGRGGGVLVHHFRLFAQSCLNSYSVSAKDENKYLRAVYVVCNIPQAQIQKKKKKKTWN